MSEKPALANNIQSGPRTLTSDRVDGSVQNMTQQENRHRTEIVSSRTAHARMHNIIKQALSYWESLCRGRATPLRSDFDPVHIPNLLPNVMLLDVIDNGQDFRYRVIGEAVRSMLFENYTGRLLSSQPHVEADGPLMRQLRQAVQTGRPVRNPIEYVGPHSDFRKLDEINLPLANESGQVTHLLVFMVLVDKATRLDGLP